MLHPLTSSVMSLLYNIATNKYIYAAVLVILSVYINVTIVGYKSSDG